MRRMRAGSKSGPSSRMLIAPRGMTPVSEDAFKALIGRVAQTLKPEKIILFGSYAYGEPTPDSDVDLLVILDTDAPRTERQWAVSRLLVPRLFPVDILVKTPAEIEEALRSADFFVREILTRGQVLYERDEQHH
jgi:predicted nucleotidyltransferase